ncbi:thioesterase family protein [uncultured Jatrophihabitans sp.]|uniref:thioesterase family protein n=1 Tax=uncultured Jatrophihabitans sp. TaxID=1610747 RepID=UPI0035CC9283
MSHLYYDLTQDRSAADELHWVCDSSPHTVGPWSPVLQHGGPPNALAVAAAERIVSQVTHRDDLTALRLGSEFVGPVPVAELEVRAAIVRAARSAVLAEVTVLAAGRRCLTSRVWFVRRADTSEQAPALGPGTELPDDLPGLDHSFGYGDSLDWRRVSGGLSEPGPGTAWTRARTGLFDGYEWSGLARAVLVADSGNGLSSELDWSAWSFVNVDLDVHLARPVVGEWVLLDAATQLGAHGSALARSTLSDRHGVVGAGLQTLVLAPARS